MPPAPSSAPDLGTASPGVAPDPLATALEERISRLWWLVSRAARSDLSRSAAATLARLREDGPQRIGALAEAEAVTQPTMTSVVQRLERDGLVHRQVDPVDARAARISITPEGERALAERAARRAGALAEQLQALRTPDRRALADALAAMDALLAQAGAR